MNLRGSLKVSLYSAVDATLTRYTVDVEAATLERGETIELLANAQYAWPHPTQRCLYVATSNRGSAAQADFNHVAAYRVDERTGALAPHGEPQALRDRAVHICVDAAGRWLLSGHNIPRPGVSVNRIEDDGTIGAAMPEPALDYGIYPHQVRVAPSNRAVVLVDRGNSSEHGKAEDPGALRVFRFGNGALSHDHAVAPNGGYGFGPRHIDFHPREPWLYVSDERLSRLHMFRMPGDRLEALPAHTLDTLADRGNLRPRQLAGPIHVHPKGHVVYVVNRADHRVERDGARVFGGGENSIAVFALDPASGEPRIVQHADTYSFHVRTFAIDPSGRLLVAASIKPLAVLEGGEVRHVPAALSVSRIADDGRLRFVRKYDVETGGGTQYWMGLVPRV